MKKEFEKANLLIVNKKCKHAIGIGIISYFPDNEYREERILRCRKLIAECDKLFNVPIIVIAQNWRNEITSKNLIKLNYQKLGITNARKTLWHYFRKSRFDWLICFDDDCILEGNKEDGGRLLEFLAKKEDGYLCGKKYEFKLCAFHKKTALRVDIPHLDVELGTGIEDYGFFKILELKFSDKEIKYEWGSIKETSCWLNDKSSNWHRQGITELIKKTNDYIKNKIKHSQVR